MSNLHKYPRTYHLPSSKGATSDDKYIKALDNFTGKLVVVTEKLDGENTTLYADYIHARSVDSKHHESRNWVKGFHAVVRHQIPDNYRVCGENLYAQHSIKYNDLESYFYGFSVWNNDLCLNWEDTLVWFEKLGIVSVPIIFTGIFDEKQINEAFSAHCLTASHEVEGYVVRTADSYQTQDFEFNVAKWVRSNHVQTDVHWMHRKVQPNGLLSR